MPILRDPLPLQNPPLLSSPTASDGEEMLIDIEILTVEIDLIGGARGCGQTGFALRFMCIFLSGIALLLVRSVFKVFEGFGEPFFKKFPKRVPDKSKFEILLGNE